jgi:hypothetical protein
VIWLMEELGLPYALKSYPRLPSYMAAPEFLALHPVGQAPVIEDGEVLLAESLAIVTYILKLYGNGALRIAPGEKGYADYVYWMAYSIGGLAPQAMNVVMRGNAGWSSTGLRSAGIVSVHHSHNGEIEVTGESTARAIWSMTGRLFMPAGGAYAVMTGYGYYHETYEKIGRAWKIKTLRIERIRVEAH